MRHPRVQPKKVCEGAGTFNTLLKAKVEDETLFFYI